MTLNELTAQIDKIKETHDLSLLVGLEESESFDAKSAHGYDLNNAVSRFELAKDVSSLANADGGYVVIGLSTEPLPTKKTEVISSLDLLKADGIEQTLSQYQGVLREVVYPAIKDLGVEWINDSAKDAHGVIVITVPKQDEDKKHFLISGILDGGKKIQGIVFGIARREGSSSNPFTVQQVHKAVLRGKHSGAERLTRIEEKVDLLLSWLEAPRGSGSAFSDVVDQRIHNAEDELLKGV